MKKFALILYGKSHSIIESEEKPNFPPTPDGKEIVLVDITGTDVMENYTYDEATNTFAPPVDPEPEPTHEPVPNEVDREIKILKAQLKAASETNALLEECIVEMAGIVYV